MSKEHGKENKMGTMPIGKLLWSMSLPAMLSMFIQAMYNIVDSIYVAQIGEHALTAVSLAFPVQNLIIAVAVGTGVGLNSLISRRLGEKKLDQANKAASHGIIIALAAAAIFALFGFFLTKPFFQAFTSDAEIISMGVSYTSIVTIFSFGCFVEIAIEKTLQATGNMIWPMVFQLTGAILNIIFDPIFIFGMFGMPKLGVTGAAVATVGGQIISMILAAYVIYAKNHAVKISFKNFKIELPILRDIFSVGFPSIIMQSIGSVMTMGMNNILMRFSSSAVAVFGVYFKLQSFVFMPVFGLGQGALPIMGYNFGARNKTRLVHTLKLSCMISATIMTVGLLIFEFLPTQLLSLFNATPDMFEIGVPALRIICISFPLAAMGISFSNFFQAVGRGVNSLFISVLRQLVLLLPMAWIFAQFLTIHQVWLAFPLSEMVAAVASVILFLRVYKNDIVDLEYYEPNEE